MSTLDATVSVLEAMRSWGVRQDAPETRDRL